MRIKKLDFSDCKSPKGLQVFLGAEWLPEKQFHADPDDRLHIQLIGLEKLPPECEQEVRELLRFFDELSQKQPYLTVEIVKRRDVYRTFRLHYEEAWENEFEATTPVLMNIGGEWVDTLTLDFTDCQTWWDVHTVLKVTYGFPEYYGRNLDALWDLLCSYTEDRLHTKIFGLKHLPQDLTEHLMPGILNVFNAVHKECPNMTFEIVK